MRKQLSVLLRIQAMRSCFPGLLPGASVSAVWLCLGVNLFFLFFKVYLDLVELLRCADFIKFRKF